MLYYCHILSVWIDIVSRWYKKQLREKPIKYKLSNNIYALITQYLKLNTYTEKIINRYSYWHIVITLGYIIYKKSEFKQALTHEKN